MTDHIDPDKVRELIERWETAAEDTVCHLGSHYRFVVRDLLALLPTPKPKTLADMDVAQREQCVGMWADIAPRYGRGIEMAVISRVVSGCATVAVNHNDNFPPHEQITPRFDMPRAWNADGTPPDMSIISPKIDTSDEHDDSVNMTPEQPIKAVTTRTVLWEPEA